MSPQIFFALANLPVLGDDRRVFSVGNTQKGFQRPAHDGYFAGPDGSFLSGASTSAVAVLRGYGMTAWKWGWAGVPDIDVSGWFLLRFAR